MKFVVRATNPTPTRNKKVIDVERRIIVMGSVEGVKTAHAIAEAITTTLHADSIFCHVISSKKPRINCRIGN